MRSIEVSKESSFNVCTVKYHGLDHDGMSAKSDYQSCIPNRWAMTLRSCLGSEVCT